MMQQVQRIAEFVENAQSVRIGKGTVLLQYFPKCAALNILPNQIRVLLVAKRFTNARKKAAGKCVYLRKDFPLPGIYAGHDFQNIVNAVFFANRHLPLSAGGKRAQNAIAFFLDDVHC
ncbi:hypothetical protein SDC9_82010 [bioreactor metagenome]|uniref:Uncharacterized protein n=1 Tax=bioreactor metagenome TaxID=1076179 RepID=A0A644Z569_9ZZZZ